MLDEDGFGHHGTRAAGTGHAGGRRQQMQKKDGEIAHAPIVSRSPNSKKRPRICNSPRTAVGQPLGLPAHSEIGSGGGQCVYGYLGSNSLNQIALEVWQFQSAAEAQKKFSDELKDSGKNAIGSQKPTPESGVGDGAFSKTGELASMKATEWMAVRGSRVVHIVSIAANVPSHDRLRGLMVTALSR